MKRTYLIPAAVFVLLAFSVLWIWRLNEENRIRTIQSSGTRIAEQLAFRMESFLSTRFAIGDHLHHEWGEGLINTPDSFLKQAASFHRLHPDFQAINWVNKDGVIRWVTPLAGNEGAIGLNLKAHPVAGNVLAAAEKLNKIQVTRPIELAQGGKGIAAYIALREGITTEGYINLVFRVEPLINAALEQGIDDAYHYQINDGDFLIYGKGPVERANPLTVRRTLKVANRQWTITLSPTAQSLQELSSFTSKLPLIFALVISIGLTWLLWLVLMRQEELGNKSRALKATLDNMDEGISMVDGDLKLVNFNQRFLELLDFPPDHFKQGDPFESFIRFNAERGEYGTGDIDELVRNRVELAKKFEPHTFERTLPNGTVLEIRGNPMPGGGFVTSYTDISQRKQAEKALLQSEERFAKAFNSSPASIAIAGIQDGLMYDVNEHWCATTGYDREDVIGKLAGDIGLWQNFKQRIQLIKALRRDKSVRDFEGTIITKSGEARDCVFNGEIIDIDNEERLLLVFHDITERKRAEDKALHMAGHDPLTGLPNRNLMRDRLEQVLVRAKRNNTKTAVMFVDLNDFKLINDRLGHKAGDHALQKISKIMQECIRASDTLARFGGDEFVIIMPDVIDEKSVTRTCEKLQHSLSKPIDLDGTQARIGASIGITLYPDHADSAETLLEMADKAMYELKHGDGLVGFKFADPKE